jgi:hypothetical protein
LQRIGSFLPQPYEQVAEAELGEPRLARRQSDRLAHEPLDTVAGLHAQIDRLAALPREGHHAPADPRERLQHRVLERRHG